MDDGIHIQCKISKRLNLMLRYRFRQLIFYKSPSLYSAFSLVSALLTLMIVVFLRPRSATAFFAGGPGIAPGTLRLPFRIGEKKINHVEYQRAFWRGMSSRTQSRVQSIKFTRGAFEHRRFNSFGAIFSDYPLPNQKLIPVSSTSMLSINAAASTALPSSSSISSVSVKSGSSDIELSESPEDDGVIKLKEALVQWRKDASFRSGKPAYRIFTNKALDSLCAFRPESQDALFCVPGIGNNILGMEEEVLSVISKYTPPNSPYKRFTVDEIKASTKKPKAKRVKKESPLKVHKDTDVTTEKTDVMSPVIPNSDAFKSDLSSEQLAAAQRALRGNNVFITGAAGTGKSHVLRYIVQELRKMHGSDCVFPVAPTGIAAINIGGSTVHSFAGIGLGTSRPDRLLSSIQKKKKVLQRWMDCRVLVIDEISMVDPDLLELLDFLAKKLKNNNKPFGGIQIIAFGDFMQLPPVKSSKEGRRLCFESPAWVAAGLASKLNVASAGKLGVNTTDKESNASIAGSSTVSHEGVLMDESTEQEEEEEEEGGTIILSTIVRQQDDADFIRILNAIRLGVPPASILAELNKCDVKFKPLPTDGIIPTKLYCTNKDVDKENQLRLSELPGQPVTFTAQDEWRIRASSAASKKEMTESMDRMVPKTFELKVGAQVMLLRNRYDIPSNSTSMAAKPELANGSRGVVIKMLRVSTKGRSSGSDVVSDTVVIPVVKFDSGQVLEVHPVETLHQEPGKKGGLLARKQIPLKLAWAITVHKSQGSTLSRAELMIQNTFDFGQAYTALSRVQSLKGLWLTKPLHVWNFKTNPVVLSYYGIELQK